MASTSRQSEPHAIHHVVARARCGGPIVATGKVRALVIDRAARTFAAVGADPARVAVGAHTRAEADAYAVVVFVACDEAGSTTVETAPHLGVGRTALLRARRRGRTILAARNLSAAEVLIRCRGLVGSQRF
ncbi:MAG: hypothetical protein K8T90_02020 [Planctomycetes bacterium]|nr:hypothetical protein [Planctomycetota bacterium]